MVVNASELAVAIVVALCESCGIMLVESELSEDDAFPLCCDCRYKFIVQSQLVEDRKLDRRSEGPAFVQPWQTILCLGSLEI